MAGKKPTVFTYRLDGILTVAVWVERRRLRLGEASEEIVWGYEVRDGKTPLFKSKGVGQPNYELVTDTYATSAWAAVALLWHLIPEEDERLPRSFANNPSALTKRQLQWFLADYRRYSVVRNINHMGWWPGAEFLLGDGTWVPIDEDGLPITPPSPELG